MISLKYIIVGTGRCGTVSLARLLTDAGIPCGHESVFDWQGINVAIDKLEGKKETSLSIVSQFEHHNGEWKAIPKWNNHEIEAESSYMAAPFLKHTCLSNTKIIHVVRNPIKVVDSFCNHLNYFQSNSPNNQYEEFIYQIIPDLKQDMNCFDRACLYYVKWNLMIESKNPDFFHCIENEIDPILEFIGFKGQIKCEKFNSIKKSGVRKFNLCNIQSDEIKNDFIEMGRRYGYNMFLDYLMI